MIEREEYSVSLDKLEALAEALGVDPIEFFRTGKRTLDRD
jgi:transcriptional regulator with XRE-family HTH domain